MKYSYTKACFALLILLSSCYSSTEVGPVGPPGPQGPIGPKGADAENAYVFEWENVNFTAPDFEVILPYPDNFEGYASDVALTYLLWDTYTTDDGEVVEVWRKLSQSIPTADGMLVYNSDFSIYDVRLFLDAEFPLTWLGADDTDAWVVRVVIVPGDFWNSGRVDFSDYQAVAKALELPEL
ncbi:hypothetical protein [Marinoscillum furvescens]|uniref:Collagen triple helix repeat protein n=1 Tax=Marinoscillum furvescens DSM 4134 TaxID=1122208 RepID=A0A3D9LI12_MARFU|nr:hypothetical protein [Marinoscillum furvescens]REE05669.1 hypothetical protein C7460_101186 [Marinoscillum furvescens DSM 4134]